MVEFVILRIILLQATTKQLTETVKICLKAYSSYYNIDIIYKVDLVSICHE